MRQPFASTFDIDPDYLSDTIEALESLPFPDISVSANSPVLGVPATLYRLLLQIIRAVSTSGKTEVCTRLELKRAMKVWEDSLFATRSESCTDQAYSEACELYILAGSLLSDLLIEMPIEMVTPESSQCSFISNLFRRWDAVSNFPRWQVEQALHKFRSPHMRRYWTSCYLGSWLFLVFGHAVETEADEELIRDLLDSACRNLGYGELARHKTELETFWRERRERKPLLDVTDQTFTPAVFDEWSSPELSDFCQ